MKAPWWFPFGHVPGISAEALADELARAKAAPQLLDVRTPAEFASGHIGGAVNVPISELRSRLDALALDPGRRVVAICLSAHRSVPAVRLLRERGFEALQLEGGMIAWRAGCRPEARS